MPVCGEYTENLHSRLRPPPFGFSGYSDEKCRVTSCFTRATVFQWPLWVEWLVHAGYTYVLRSDEDPSPCA